MNKAVVILTLMISLPGCALPSARSSQAQIQKQLAAIEQHVQRPNQRDESVSVWSVHQQAEHVLLANSGILKLIETAERPAQPGERSLRGWFVLRFGFIPRGQAKAPEAVIPKERAREELLQLVSESRERIARLDVSALEEDEEPVGNHPYFGALSSREWLRFMSVHGRHHLKIVDDILAAGK